MAEIEKFRTPRSMQQRELDEGLADADAEKQLLKIAAGVRRRITFIESRPDSGRDIKTHIQYEHIMHREKIADQDPFEPETRDYEKGGWEIHFRKHLDSLELPDLLTETEKYLQMLATDSSAVQEYRLCIELLDSIAASGIENTSFSIKDGNIEVSSQDRSFHFPTNIKLETGREVHCRAVGLEHKHSLKAFDSYTDNLEACRRILETEDIDSGFGILLERMGYTNEMAPEDREVFNPAGSIVPLELWSQNAPSKPQKRNIKKTPTLSRLCRFIRFRRDQQGVLFFGFLARSCQFSLRHA